MQRPACVVGFVLGFSSSLQATTITSVASGSWTTTATWNPAQVPGAGDDVFIVSGFNVSLPSAQTANSLTLNTGGTLSGSGTLTVGTLTWNDGTLGQALGSLTVTTSATIATASNNHLLDQFTLNNQGTMTWASGAGELHFSNAAVFSNSGTFNIQTDAGVRYDSGNPPTINNSGTFRKSAGSGTTIIGVANPFPFNNNGGTLDVQTGLLQFAGAVTLNGSGVLTSGTVVLSSGANVISNGAVYTGVGYWRLPGSSGLSIAAGSSSMRNVELSGGTINGAGALTITGNLKWNTGTIGTGAGSVSISASATVDVLTASNAHDFKKLDNALSSFFGLTSHSVKPARLLHFFPPLFTVLGIVF